MKFRFLGIVVGFQNMHSFVHVVACSNKTDAGKVNVFELVNCLNKKGVYYATRGAKVITAKGLVYLVIKY